MILVLLACAAEAVNGAPFSVPQRALADQPPPTEDGIYRLQGDAFTLLPTNTTLGTGAGSAEEAVRYPLFLPGTTPTLAPGERLVLVGTGVDAWHVFGLAPSSHVPGSLAGPETAPWHVVSADTIAVATEEVEIEGATDRAAERSLRAFSAGELPPGRYVLSSPHSTRAFLFEAASR